jgi:hypothetical protein
MPRQSDRATVNATVPSDVKAALVQRAEAEDRTEGSVVKRALRLYLSMPVEETEQRLRELGTPKAPTE